MSRKHPPRQTFADVVAEVEAQPRAEPQTPRGGPGFTGDGRILGPDGRIYADETDIEVDRASAVLAEKPLIMIDDCGCRGGCSVEWVTDAQDPRAAQVPWVPTRKHKRVDAQITEWRAEDGHALLLYEGPDFRWTQR